MFDVKRAQIVARRDPRTPKESSYLAPEHVQQTTLGDILRGLRPIPEDQQIRLGITDETCKGLRLWVAGDVSLIRKSCVAVVGARKVSSQGAARARRIGCELARAGVVIVSGLAYGVDTQVLTSAIDAGGRVIAVIGTPVDTAYPAANKRLQELIYREHLLVSQFQPGKRVFPTNFPERNKLMAAISDATVIIEASDTSGSLHQAAECVRLNRWLFIAKSIMDDPNLKWPHEFSKYQNMKILRSTSDIFQTLGLSSLCHST